MPQGEVEKTVTLGEMAKEVLYTSQIGQFFGRENTIMVVCDVLIEDEGWSPKRVKDFERRVRRRLKT